LPSRSFSAQTFNFVLTLSLIILSTLFILPLGITCLPCYYQPINLILSPNILSLISLLLTRPFAAAVPNPATACRTDSSLPFVPNTSPAANAYATILLHIPLHYHPS
jgi:hypothetical protein